MFYVEHPDEAAFLSAGEIARRLGTSDATVVRTVKALGYSGMADLRRELTNHLRGVATPVLRAARSIKDAGEDPLGYVLAREIGLLERARSIDREEVLRAVDALVRAERVLTFGLGPMGALARYFALRLGRLGLPARAITVSGLLLADELLAMRKGDALVVLAYDRLDRDAATLLGRADELALPIVLLTDTRASWTERIPVVLAAPRSSGGSLSGATVPLAILDALLLALAAHDRGRSLATLAELNELRRRLRGKPVREQLE